MQIDTTNSSESPAMFVYVQALWLPFAMLSNLTLWVCVSEAFSLLPSNIMVQGFRVLSYVAAMHHS